MRKLASVRTTTLGQGWFVTLTYQTDPGIDAAKGHLRALFERLHRGDSGYACVWKLEPQQRGVPHFHLLIWSDHVDRKWLRQSWLEIVGVESSAHYQHGVMADPMRSWTKLRRYVDKYAAKETADRLEWGRRWGLRGECDTRSYCYRLCSRGEAADLKRILRGLLRSETRRRGEARTASWVNVNNGTWVGVENPARLVEYLDSRTVTAI